MARKKKEKIIEEYIPSKYQERIYSFVKEGQGNAVIEAVAGSGKSYSLIQCLKLIPEEKRVLVTAFNNSIVDELKKKIKKEKNIQADIDCRTLHSLGLALLRCNYPGQIDPQPNDFKYSSYIYNNVHEFGGKFYASLPKKDHAKFIDNVKKFVDFGRFYLCETVADLGFIETYYNIPTFANEKEIAIDVLKWGKENIDTIDFTDMIWLPIVLNCKPYKYIYDWILADECQDLSKAERELILRCTKMQTRMLFFGQKIQSINSFQGSDYQSFEELQKLPNTISLPLSISYRCAKEIVKFANRYCPEMEAADNAIDGEIKRDVEISDLQDGDMVVCRVNAPLVQLYCELAKQGKMAVIKGKDIGKSLIKEIKKTKENMLFPQLNNKGVFSALYNNLINDIDVVMRKNGISFEMSVDDMDISQKYDAIQALEAISDGLNTADELINKISSLFSDKKAKGISLSTIHKAKGLEADNVYICCPSLLPAKSAKEKWEIQQESNLEYVAFTRPKKVLGFMKEDDFTNYSSNTMQKASALLVKKAQIFQIYGEHDRCSAVKPTKEAAKFILEHKTDIKIKPKNAKVLSESGVSNSFSSIAAIQNRQKVKRRVKI